MYIKLKEHNSDAIQGFVEHKINLNINSIDIIIAIA